MRNRFESVTIRQRSAPSRRVDGGSQRDEQVRLARRCGERPRRQFARSIATLAQDEADGRRQAVEQFRRGRDSIAQRDVRGSQRIDARSRAVPQLVPQPIDGVRSSVATRPPARRGRNTPPARSSWIRSRRSGAQIRQIVVFFGRTREGNHVRPAHRHGAVSDAIWTSSQSPAGVLRPSVPSTALTRLTVARSTMPGYAPAASHARS